MGQTTNAVAIFEQTKENGLVNPQKLTELSQVKEKFIGLYNATHGLPKEHERGGMYFAAEQLHFSQRIMDDDKLRKCTPLSLYKAFINTAVNGLSFDPSKNQVYMIPYGEQCKTEVSPYGEAQMRINQGIIEGYDDPILVFDCDLFEPEQKNGGWNIQHKPKFPRPEGSKIIACYVNIHKPDGTISTVIFGMDEIEQFRGAAISKIDKMRTNDDYKKSLKAQKIEQYQAGGMIKAKALKHAMKRQPAVRLLGEQIAPQKEEKISEVSLNYDLEEVETVEQTTQQPETEQPEIIAVQSEDLTEEAF